MANANPLSPSPLRRRQIPLALTGEHAVRGPGPRFSKVAFQGSRDAGQAGLSGDDAVFDAVATISSAGVFSRIRVALAALAV